jgi:DNA-directed RNA polymerase specialized sigma24 family protein
VVRELYEECVRVASASSRGAQSARDLVHDVLLDALERSVADLSAPERRAWLRGALRKRAAFDARTAVRRRSREARWTHEHDAPARQPWRFAPELLARLSPALRVLATLASAELDAHEIRSVLGLSDSAYRKRLSDLRHAVQGATAAGLAVMSRPAVMYTLGPARAELLTNLKNHDSWAIASHDPDGHALIFARIDAHETAPRGNPG